MVLQGLWRVLGLLGPEPWVWAYVLMIVGLWVSTFPSTSLKVSSSVKEG